MAQQIIENPGSVFGRLGAGLGKGLAEQLPKEVERSRLSSGLDKFKKESLSKSPLEQAVDLYKIPGFTAEMGYTLAPLLQQQRSREGTVKYGKGAEPGAQQPGQAPNDMQRGAQGVQPQTQGAKAPQSITNLETEAATRQPNYPPTTPEINALAAELVQSQPDLFPNREAAVAEASNLLNDEYNRKKALKEQSAINDADKTWIDNEIAKQAGEVNAGKYAQEEYQKLRDEAYQEVGQGKKTKLEAAREAKDKILELDKTITSLKNIDAKWFPKPEAAKKALENIREKFKGKEELLSNLLTSEWGLSPHYAKILSNPIKENKEINNQLSKLKTEHLGGAEYIKNADKGYPRETKIANDIASHLKPNDSLLAIALELHNKGYNEIGFIDEINRLRKAGKISLSEPQINELKKTPQVRPSMNDYYYFTMSGLEKLLEQP